MRGNMFDFMSGRAAEVLIIPGGESTTMAIFLKRNNFHEQLANWIHGEEH